ncbi:ATP-binding cassette sub-family B member 6, mitochondrial [Orchesella cincta]|uniref:ATP-binding cassette sub-family B member 6 n=1 Tax=Orchesella cincta TaxID=48709 RepID=A0A1D2N363_ORCCI|nr:ATP-binding cassette sub-family B member 6, mitochondrial [Orchesella cincta]
MLSPQQVPVQILNAARDNISLTTVKPNNNISFLSTIERPIEYCPPNETLVPHILRDGGVSQCFAETISSSVTLGFILLFGTIQFFFYRKYAIEVQHYTLPYSRLFGLQMMLNGLMPLVVFGQVAVKVFLGDPQAVYGYMLLSLIQGLLAWPLVCVLVIRERIYMLPAPPARGHGVILLMFWTAAFAFENLALLNIYSEDWFFKLKNPKDIVLLSIYVCKYVFTGGVFILGIRAPGIPTVRHSESFTRLHPNGDDEQRGTVSSGSAFGNLRHKIKLLMPFIWPSKSLALQFNVLICLVILVAGRVTNLFVPIYNKKIVDSMTLLNSSSSDDRTFSFSFGAGPSHLAFRWDFVLIMVGLKLLQGGGAGGTGVLNNFRSLLWINVEQYTTREVQIEFFGHLHRLSLRWHLQRKTGEVLRAMDRGTDSINNILNYLLFSIFPTIADIIIAISFLTSSFNVWFGLIVFIAMVLYLICTFAVTEWRTKYRRTMNLSDNEQRQRAIDSLLNFETVKYYANENYETKRYSESILKYQKEEWKVTASLCILNFLQLVIINGALLIGSLLCVKMVVYHEGFTVGDYILFTTYLMQLYAPLNYFGTYYRMLQKCFIDMENMLDLFKEEEEVKDAKDARDLIINSGVIEFRNVCFSYIPEKTVLKNVSFCVPAGQSVALVGPSGGGKTSIIRLLFRFYDPVSGDIFIDGQNIKVITQQSLRKTIGVVPQDTVLFNDSIKYNILYGKVGSTEHQMFEAARCAHIHDRIASFPERYDTAVGERGLKLSGGEKQRVAIARTLLKNPAIILLDEATSALDTHTERQIQTSLQRLCANRTSIIVAHRLSTIVDCDQILVLKDGCIVEGGSN